MTQKEIDEFAALLRKQRKEVLSSKKAAREFLDSFGLLTPKGKLKRKFIGPANVPR
jgi:hypothetical protein